ncbi:MarR family transcriptional regulator [Thioclava sp. BHET1]|nr:MarR family transcriptional regulator [Thioclava sp. BHET1]
MSSIRSVQNTHINVLSRDLHGALLDIVSVMNRPQRDATMVQEAGISLDRALFPLLVMIERLGPIGIIDLADRVGRDYTTVSRQVTKLESLGLADRRDNPSDGRSRQVVVTPAGKAMAERVDAARDRVARAIFSTWKEEDVVSLVRLMRRLADSMKTDPKNAAGET